MVFAKALLVTEGLLMFNIKFGKSVILLVLLALLLVSMPTSLAQDNDFCDIAIDEIEYGDTVEDEIDDDAFFLWYCFEGEEGDEVILTAEATDGDLLLLLGIGDSFLEEIFEETAAVEEEEELEVVFELPEDGNYLVIISRDGLEEGDTEGEFEVTLDIANGDTDDDDDDDNDDDATDFCNEIADEIEDGDEVDADIDDELPFAAFCFVGEEGDEVTLTAETTDNDLVLLISVSDSLLEEIYEQEEADDEDEEIEIVFEVPDDGNYLIVVARADEDTDGEFEMTLEIEASDSDDEEMVEECEESGFEFLPYDETVDGDIDDDNVFAIYCVIGEEDDEITLIVEADDGLIVGVAITSPDIEEIYEEVFADDEDEELEIVFELPDDGEYVILITREDFDDGDSEGSFELTIETDAR